MLLVADRHCRLALRAGDQLQKAELHFREGIMGYEGMAWPHLTLHLFTIQERCHRECILSMSKLEWKALQHTVFSIKAFSATMARFVRKQLATERRERQERNYAVHLFLLEAHFIAQKEIDTGLVEWYHSVWVGHLVWGERMAQRTILGLTRGEGRFLFLRARELRDRVGIGHQSQEEQSSIWLAMLLHRSGLQQRALMGREGIVRQMLEAGARRAEASLFVYYQGIVELLPTPQYGKSVSLTHPDDAASPTTQPPTPPVPYAEYLQQWDGGRGQGGAPIAQASLQGDNHVAR